MGSLGFSYTVSHRWINIWFYYIFFFFFTCMPLISFCCPYCIGNHTLNKIKDSGQLSHAPHLQRKALSLASKCHDSCRVFREILSQTKEFPSIPGFLRGRFYYHKLVLEFLWNYRDHQIRFFSLFSEYNKLHYFFKILRQPYISGWIPLDHSTLFLYHITRFYFIIFC